MYIYNNNNFKIFNISWVAPHENEKIAFNGTLTVGQI